MAKTLAYPFMFDLDIFLEKAKKRQKIDESGFLALCDYVIEILLEEPNCIAVQAPVTICGDIHGQFYDLLQLFKMGGQVPRTKYVFMGDYVDRGHYSLETLTYLLCLKAKYPDRIVLLRGNHETRSISQSYGFFDDCMKRYGYSYPWIKCNEVFDALPIAALISNEILCVHGGLSPDIRTLAQISMVPRRQEVPPQGALSDLMWSDPDTQVLEWMMSQRGAGYLFGQKVTNEFNHINKLTLLCRAHQLVMEGYMYSFPSESLVTVWSAPNYCYRCGNIASIMQLSPSLERRFILYSEVPDSMREIPPRMPVPYFM
ncbi:MAG: putative Serine/threonine-protein phosphatase 6 catalytic subunit [Streblomastix strix]|uniref:Serine/threonine-protein phosphatase n=1 Tax=Streblomastix strix TaxID=222440 RepID=A0A5J4V6D7_9EUKA|nr:MAG: putative Serine/threonine-protein phosphatase 6 catalytic subunit [Streblomastix strix]